MSSVLMRHEILCTTIKMTQHFHVVGKTDSLKENQKYKEIPVEFLWDYIIQQHGTLC